MKYSVPGISPVNVTLVEVVSISVWELPGTANWILAEYLVAPATAFHENTIELDVADEHVKPVGAGNGADILQPHPSAHLDVENPNPSGGSPETPATETASSPPIGPGTPSNAGKPPGGAPRTTGTGPPGPTTSGPSVGGPDATAATGTPPPSADEPPSAAVTNGGPATSTSHGATPDTARTGPTTAGNSGPSPGGPDTTAATGTGTLPPAATATTDAPPTTGSSGPSPGGPDTTALTGTGTPPSAGPGSTGPNGPSAGGPDTPLPTADTPQETDAPPETDAPQETDAPPETDPPTAGNSGPSAGGPDATAATGTPLPGDPLSEPRPSTEGSNGPSAGGSDAAATTPLPAANMPPKPESPTFSAPPSVLASQSAGPGKPPTDCPATGTVTPAVNDQAATTTPKDLNHSAGHATYARLLTANSKSDFYRLGPSRQKHGVAHSGLAAP